MSNVFVIDTKKQPLKPVHPGTAIRKALGGSSGSSGYRNRHEPTYRMRGLAARLIDSLQARNMTRLRLEIEPMLGANP
jgi:hypothetical protein